MYSQFHDSDRRSMVLGILFVVLILGAGIMSAGCCGRISDKEASTAPNPAPAEQVAPQVATSPDLVPGPTNLVPSNLDVQTTTFKDPITGEISVSVDGGNGMNLLDTIKVSSYGENGLENHEEMKNPKIGDSVKFPGTPDGKDRVMIYKSYKNGQEYITDDMVLEGRDTSSSGGSSTGGGGSC